MEQLHSSAVFMASVILTGVGLLFALGFVLIANNLLHRFWKDLNWKWWAPYSDRYEFVDVQQKPMSIDPKQK